MKEPVILITGAAGFIGAHLTEKLLRERGALHIIGLDNLNDYYDVSLKRYRLEQIAAAAGAEGRWTFVEGDLADRELLERLFRERQPDIVVNLAAQAGVRYSLVNPDAYIGSNILGFYHILEACRRSLEGRYGYPGVRHLFYASSSSVYGLNQKVPYSTEDRTDWPVSLYAATKKSNEVMAYSYAKLYRIPMTGLRFFTVYGPAGRPDMAYYSFTRKLLAGEKIQVFNYGNCWRDFTYIDDITEGIARMLRPVCDGAANETNPAGAEAPYALYNIGNHHPEKLTDFIAALHRELIRAGALPEGHVLADQMELVPMQPGDVERTFADVSDLERDFGFHPATALEDGLRKFVTWYCDYYGVR